MFRRLIAIALVSLVSLIPVVLLAQRDTGTVVLRGIVTGKAGRPLRDALVVDATSLEGVRTDSLGRFRFAIREADSVVIVARAIGYQPFRRVVPRAARNQPIDIVLSALAPQLSAITVAASTYVASTERTATLTPLQVATTPGANADVNRAVQTLPGVQLSDEGNGITTRGGDVTETRAFIDGAPLLNPVETVTPAGSVAATINPFLLDRITFSSGGFDVAYGNTMSGIVDLQSQTRPAASFVSGNLTMAGAAMSAGLALRHRVGASGTISRNTISPLTAVNGNPRAFDPVPNGGSLSGNIGWGYRDGGAVKLFALRQTNRLGITIDDPRGDFAFRTARRSHVAVLSVRDSSEHVTIVAAASSSGLVRNEMLGAVTLATTLRSLQTTVRTEWRPNSRLQMRGGLEAERLAEDFVKQNPFVMRPDSTRFSVDRGELRTAAFAEISVAARDSLRLTAGVRREASGFASRRVIDPRVSVAWMPTPYFALTAAWGVYSQLADPAYLNRGDGQRITLPFQRAMHSVVGLQHTQRAVFVRAEVWHKRWRDLVQLNREFLPVRDGIGHAKGADLFLRARTPFRSELRTTYSLIRARRTDPASGVVAPALGDITHSVTAILETTLPRRFAMSIASRYATGRPYTDVAGATNIGDGMFAPVYSAPYAARLSPIARTDISLSRTLNVGPNRFGVLFAGFGNVFNRRNAQSVTWNGDYSERRVIRSVSNRSIFVGGTLSLTAPTR